MKTSLILLSSIGVVFVFIFALRLSDLGEEPIRTSISYGNVKDELSDLETLSTTWQSALSSDSGIVTVRYLNNGVSNTVTLRSIEGDGSPLSVYFEEEKNRVWILQDTHFWVLENMDSAEVNDYPQISDMKTWSGDIPDRVSSRFEAKS